MEKTLRAGAVQFPIALGDIDENLQRAKRGLAELARRGCSLAVMPEMWSTGYSYRTLRELSERSGSLLEEIAQLSRQHSMTIVGSLPEPRGDKVANTAYVVDRGEIAGVYRKIHLFSMMGEDRALEAGAEPLVVQTHAGRLGVFICYDLRFPELARRLALDGAEILVVPAEWPRPREDHWRTLLRARAIENQLFVVAANCCGAYGKLEFFGDSMIVGPKGEMLAEAGADETAIDALLDLSSMEQWRSQIPCFADRRPASY